MLNARRGVESARGCFKNRFRDVMLVPPIKIFDVEIEAALLHKRFQKLFDQFRLKVPDARRFELGFVHEIRSSRKINDDASERFIQRNICVAKTDDSSPFAQRFAKRLS